jgi:hypothetical protein
MGIAIVFPRPDGPGLDGHLRPRASRILWIEFEHAVHILEVTANIRDHHVPHRELGCGMPRFKHPSCHWTIPSLAGFEAA